MPSYEEKMYEPLNQLSEVQRKQIESLEVKNRRLEKERKDCIRTLKTVNQLNEQGRLEESMRLLEGFLRGIGAYK